MIRPGFAATLRFSRDRYSLAIHLPGVIRRLNIPATADWRRPNHSLSHPGRRRATATVRLHWRSGKPAADRLVLAPGRRAQPRQPQASPRTRANRRAHRHAAPASRSRGRRNHRRHRGGTPRPRIDAPPGRLENFVDTPYHRCYVFPPIWFNRGSAPPDGPGRGRDSAKPV